MMDEPYPSLRIRFTIQGITGNVAALLDTGFDGYLAIPESTIAAFPLPLGRQPILTASGEQVRVPIYRGTIELIGMPRPIAAPIIAIGDEYLLGLATLNHFKVTFDHGQRVIVEP